MTLWYLIAYGPPGRSGSEWYVLASTEDEARALVSSHVREGYAVERVRELAEPSKRLYDQPIFDSPLTVGEWLARQAAPLSTESTEGAGQALLF